MKKRFLKRFVNDEKGAFLLIVGLSLALLVAAAGAGYDLGYQQLVRQRLQQSSDAAALAGASLVKQGDADDVEAARTQTAAAFFRMNFGGEKFLNVNRPTPSIQINAANNDISVGASTTMPTSFVRTVGVSNLTATGRSVTQIRGKFNTIDLILVLDNSNSMGIEDMGTDAPYRNGYIPGMEDGCRFEFTNPEQVAYLTATSSDGTNPRYDFFCTEAYNDTLLSDPPRPAPNFWGFKNRTRLSVMREAASNLVRQLQFENGNPNGNRIAQVHWDNILVRSSPFDAQYNSNQWWLDIMFAGWETDSSKGLEAAYNRASSDFRSNAVRAVIFLTDGKNCTNKEDKYCDSANDKARRNSINSASLDFCRRIKELDSDNPTLVFTIGFGNEINSDATTIRPFLSDCATGPNGPVVADGSPYGKYPNEGRYFFPAPDAASLSTAFDKIVGTLNKVRIKE